jgi:cation diffusion facilitator CzcD-associated flavoprotein CzcO
MKKHVIIIGAGPSGLVAMKELVEKGHTVTCLEKSAYIGGAFAKDKVYQTLYLTISNLLMAFSDFVPKDHNSTISYSSTQQYLTYLEEYTTHFKLWDYIKLQTQVTHASIDKSTGKWVVKTKKTEGMGEETYSSDVLIVATGANHLPKVIDLPGYTGKVTHSADYREESSFKGLNVLVVGVGESSSDLANEISKVAKKCTVWARKHTLLGPRYLTIIEDKKFNEEELLQTSANRADKVNIFLETATTNRLAGWLPLWYFGLIRQIIWIKRKDITPMTLVADWSPSVCIFEGTKRGLRRRMVAWLWHMQQGDWIRSCPKRLSSMVGKLPSPKLFGTMKRYHYAQHP